MLIPMLKKMGVILIVSMFLQVFISGAPVLAEDSNDLIAEPEFVPMLAVTLSPGETTGAAAATVTGHVYGSLLVNITEQEIATPQAGDTAPTAGDNMVAEYASGADITVGVAAGNYLQIYDVDMEKDAKVIAFYQVKLTEADIKERAIEESIKESEEGAGEEIGEGAEDESAGDSDTELMVALGYGYIDENGKTKFTRTKTVTKITSNTNILNDGWYIAEGSINRTGTPYSSGSITVNGHVHLILANNSSLTVSGGGDDAGIYVPKDNSLTIYAQSKGDEMGTLNAAGNAWGKYGFSAGIGGRYRGSPDFLGERSLSCGDITINGGRIVATGGDYAAGIGGGSDGYGGKITINGGIVNAIGGNYAAGIGGGYKSSGGQVIIEGGTVIAAGGANGAGIGSGAEGYFGEIIINDDAATITAAGSFGGEDIGNGKFGMGATVIWSSDVKGIGLTDGPVAGFGNALGFPANSQSRINVPFKKTRLDEYRNDDTKVSGNSDFTISMWIFPKENEPYQTIYRQEGDTIGHLGLDFRFIKLNDNEGYLYYGFNKLNHGWQWVWNWNNGIPPANIARIPINEWTHVALTKAGKNVALFVNGMKYYEMVLDDIHYNAPAPLNGDISIGGTPIENQFFCGRMDEIQFWNTALASDEIKAWMYREIDQTHPKYNNLVYYYKLNQNSGTSVKDTKGAYNGTAVNMTDGNWVASGVRGWTVDAGETLNGELVGSHVKGSSNDGTDWSLTFEIVEQAKKGTVTITGANKFQYCTYDTSQKGHDFFTYKVQGSNSRYSNIQAVNIDIIPAPINYMDENGEVKSIGFYNVNKITQDTTVINSGWYIVEGNINRSDIISVNGDVHLILADNSSLTVSGFFDAGINVSENNSLTIYAQSDGKKTGSLIATGSAFGAGIGANNGDCGNIIINGGVITARGGSGSTGIGGGREGTGGNITINGGTVTAIGGNYGAGIGWGYRGSGGFVSIGGGTVVATGGNRGAGIGGGYHANGGTIIIKNHPTVISTGNEGAADIGDGGAGEGTTDIKHESIGGTDLTYVRLEVEDLSPDNTYKIVFLAKEHQMINALLTGFFVEKSAKSLDIRLEPVSALLNITPGDVQNSRITIKKSDYATPVAGFGNELEFPANSPSRIDIPVNLDTIKGGDSDFTLSMWIFPSHKSTYQTLYRQYNAAREFLGIWLRYIKSNDNEGYLYLGFDVTSVIGGGWQWAWDWNNGIPPADVAKIPMNRWTHVALTKSERNVILYANGIKYYEMILDDKHYDALAPFMANISIGGTTIDDQLFKGRMDEIQFWNTALASDEIKAWMYREIDQTHPKYNNLVYYYKLNQNSGTSVKDTKGAYNGTAVNMTDGNWVASGVRGWTVDAGETLNGELVGSHVKGSSNDGTDWSLTFEIVEQAKKGTVTITGANKFQYCTYDTSQKGHDFFTYKVQGSNSRYSNIQAVNIDIIPAPKLDWPLDSKGPTPSQQSADTGVKIIVNGKTETTATATTTREGDKTITNVIVDDKKIEKGLAQVGSNAVITIPVMSGADVVSATLNGQTVQNMKSKDAVLEIKTGQVTYTLPAAQINIDALSEQLGQQVELKDIAISVKISAPAENTVKIVEDTADKNNYQIMVRPIEFEITCSGGDKTVEISRFNAYVERLIAIPEGVDPLRVTTGVILNDDGTFSPVPTAIIIIDGKCYAKINSLGNSIYTVINSPKTFKDIVGHWAEKDVNNMASRLIISGVGEGLFEPERHITRAEFSAVMVRALGLRPEEYRENFSDVKTGNWYTEDITTVSHYNLVKGYDDGTFKPDTNITRQEAMAILARAMIITRLEKELGKDAGEILAVFNDSADVSGWAEDSVSKCIKTGVVAGKDNNRISPRDNITRAETVIMVHRLLFNSDLIN